MKLIKLGIRFWITITSLFSFAGGWIMLAHSPKPVSQSNHARSRQAIAAPMPTLQPLDPLNLPGNGNSHEFQNSPLIVQQPDPFLGMPIFRTGGS